MMIISSNYEILLLFFVANMFSRFLQTYIVDYLGELVFCLSESLVESRLLLDLWCGCETYIDTRSITNSIEANWNSTHVPDMNDDVMLVVICDMWYLVLFLFVYFVCCLFVCFVFSFSFTSLSSSHHTNFQTKTKTYYQ